MATIKQLLTATTGSSLLLAGLLVPTAAATPDDGELLTFKVSELTWDDFVWGDSESVAGDDGGLVAITPTKVLRGGQSDGAAFPFDMTSPVGADFHDESTLIVNDLRDQSTYVIQPDATPSGSPDAGDGKAGSDLGAASLDGPFTWSSLVKLDDTGNLTATVVTLSQTISVAADAKYVDLTTYDGNRMCVHLASGHGAVGVWDVCSGTVWIVELPSGHVTKTEGLATFADLEDDDVVPYNGSSETSDVAGMPSVASGVLEYIDGAYRFLLIASTLSGSNTEYAKTIDRFSPFTRSAAPVEVLDLRIADIAFYPSADDFYTFSVSPGAGLWCGHEESANSAFFHQLDPDARGETSFCADAVFEHQHKTTPTLPPTGGGSATVFALGLMTVGLALLRISRRPAAT